MQLRCQSRTVRLSSLLNSGSQMPCEPLLKPEDKEEDEGLLAGLRSYCACFDPKKFFAKQDAKVRNYNSDHELQGSHRY